MKRRAFLRAAALCLAASPLTKAAQYSTSPGLPASASGIVVVELANFHCNRCRAVDDHFERLRSAARDEGHDLRFAPIAWQGQSIWPDRTYYATRDLFPAAESLIRSAMFDGLQREGMLFESIAQVLAYLERRQVPEKALKLEPNFSLAAIATRANAEETLLAEAKASRLVGMSGADAVPVFVWVQDGQVIKTISPSDSAEPMGLVQRVYRELTKPTTN